jgi:predicted nucleic-acid-binding protein
MNKRLLDTNMIVRYLVRGDPKQFGLAEHLFERCERGDLTLEILPVVLAECVFVLESFYEQDRADIARALSAMITAPHVEVASMAIYVDALARYAQGRMHLVDCIIAAHAAASELPVATFDRDFAKVAGVRVEVD